MTIKLKSKTPYWAKFSVYQSFESVKAMNDSIKQFHKVYSVTPAVKAVLNTIKLHAKEFPGVCWLYRDKIAAKAKVSLSSVKRAIKELKEIGILTVHENMHTERGGRTHNVYVINDVIKPEEKPANEPSSEDVSSRSETVVARVSDDQPQSHKNPYTNPNKTLKDISKRGEQIDMTVASDKIISSDILKRVPKEFVDLMKPFYANNPEMILARWKTVCVAVKKNCGKFAYTSWETIGQAWKDTVKKLKRGRIKTATDDGIGGYFYGVLSDYLMDNYWRNAAGTRI